MRRPRSVRKWLEGKLSSPSRSRLRLDDETKAGTGDLGAFLSRLQAAVAENDFNRLDELIGDFKAFNLAVAEALSPSTRGRVGVPLEIGSGIQSKQFMIDLLPHIQSFLGGYKRGSAFSVLDVGSGTGHGANLLASLYARAELGYTLKVTCLDINEHYRRYIEGICSYVSFKRQNVFALEESYDLVIASHVVEHVKEAVGFCEQLQRCAREAVFIAAPFEEPEDRLTNGHVHSLGQEFLDQLDTRSTHIMESRAWGNFLSPPYRMFIAELPGKAR